MEKDNQVPNDEEAFKSGEESTIFETKGVKKCLERANTFKVRSRKSLSRAKGAQASKVKKKKKAEWEKVAKTGRDQGQLVQELLVPIILEEYMLGEWLRNVK